MWTEGTGRHVECGRVKPIPFSGNVCLDSASTTKLNVGKWECVEWVFTMIQVIWRSNYVIRMRQAQEYVLKLSHHLNTCT